MASLTGNSPGALSRARGRPKGSGIDDASDLASVRDMLAADHKLKPTTAIKRLGIGDPSTIRRLRNKLAQPVAAGPATPHTPERTSERATKAIPTQASPIEVPAPEETAQARETALLKAYLEALRVTSPAPPAPPVEPAATPAATPLSAHDRSGETRHQQASAATPPPPPFGAFPGFPPGFPPLPGGLPGMPGGFPSGPAFPPMPGFNLFGGIPSMPGGGSPFSIPGFPSFMQPMQQKAAPPQPGTDTYRQLEAFKLAIEAMTAIARFQLHLVQNVAAYSPMALMLQGQAFMGQMLMASLTGQMDAARRMNPPPPVGR